MRKPYKWFNILCLICMSNVQGDRDKKFGKECTPFPKKEK
jgi:hypothetical protein